MLIFFKYDFFLTIITVLNSIHNAMQITYNYSLSLMHNFCQSDQIMNQKVLVFQ